MKKIFFFISLFVLLSNIKSQNWQLSNAILGSNIEPRHSTIDDQNNSYILSIFSDTIYSPYSVISRGSRDLFITKVNSLGNVVWNKHIGSRGNEIEGGITTDNNYIYVTGTFYNNCRFSENDSLISSGTTGDIFLAKYNLDGDLQWAKKIGSSSRFETTLDIKYFKDNLIICGAFRDSLIIGSSLADKDTFLTNGYASNFIAEFNLNGLRNWSKQILGTNNLSRIIKIATTEDSYFFGGYYQSSLIFDVRTIISYSATFDAFLYKTDLQGNGQWVRTIRGQNAETIRSLATDEFNNVYFLGNYTSPQIYVDSTESLINTYSGNAQGSDTYIGKFNRSGIMQWFVRKGSSAKDNYLDFVVRNNVIYATGFFTNEIIFNNDTLRTSGVNNSDAFLAVFNQIGDPITGVSIIGSGDYEDAGKIVKMDMSSRAYISGYFRSPQIQIGDQTYTSNNFNKSDLFFAIYQQPLKAVITNERNVSCNGLNDGMLAVTPYFGRPPYTYSWSHDAALRDPVADNLAAGTYTVTVTDANSKTASISGVVKQSAALAIDSLITPVSCYNNGQNGAIDITVSGGTKKGDYSYFWTTINGNGIVPLSQDQTGLSAGTYILQVKDANQCTLTEDFTVLQPEPFNFSASDTNHIISPDIRKGSIDLEVTGGNAPYASFAWTGPSGYTATSEDIGNLDNVGVYTVTLTDSKGCVTDTAFTILDNLTLFAEISAKTDVVCFGDNNGSATVTVHNGTPPYSYKWDDEPSARNDATRPNMGPGLYTVTVTDGANKTSLPAKVVITQPTALVATIPDITTKNLRCADDNSGVINLIVSGGVLPYTYSWDNGYNGEDLVNVAAGNFTVTITDKKGCTAQATKEITQPAGLFITPVITDAILCHGGRTVDVTANVTGGVQFPDYPHYNFVWDDPGTQTTPTASDLGAGTYRIKVTDNSQCSMSTAVVINEPDELSYTAVVTNPSCPGLSDGSIVITPVGGTGPGYEFIWDNNVFTRVNTSIPAGRYILTMNDANYCTIVDTFFLADPEPLEIVSADITDVSCLGKTDGSITVNAQGGTGTIEYSSDNGQTYGTANVLNSLTGGDYIVAIRDENKCTSVTLPVSVAVLDTVKATWRLTDVTCLGLANGSIAVDAAGGSGNYEYSIDGGDTFSINDSTGALATGDYVVLVTDDNDCLSEKFPVTLAALDTIEIVQVTETDLTCSGINDGSIAIVASGGTGTYEYSIDGGTSFLATSTVGSLAEGNYSVIARDDEGCSSESVAATLTRPEVCGLLIYNAFSPNDDGKNEVWNIGNAGSFPNIKVKIFNIWGKEVFASSGYAEPWDGTYNGNDLPAGTYYYIIDPGDGSDVLSGDVSIVK